MMDIDAYTEKKKEEKDYETSSGFYQAKWRLGPIPNSKSPLLFNEELVFEQ